MTFNIGDTIKVKNTELLVLDIIDNHPFVIALNTGIQTKFAEAGNNYNGSILKDAVDKWAKELDVPTIPRILDLTTMDGSKCYGSIEVEAAPLTFDEWRKYAEIIIPHTKNWFWLATGWSNPKWKNWNSNYVCGVSSDGSASAGRYNGSVGLAPAFILDKKFFEEPHPRTLANFSTDDLLAEIARRMKGA